MRTPLKTLFVAIGIAASGMIAAAADPPPWAYPRVPSDIRVDPYRDGGPNNFYEPENGYKDIYRKIWGK